MKALSNPWISVLLVSIFLAALAGCETTDPSAEQPIGLDDPPADTSCVTVGCDDGDGCTDDRCELVAGTYRCFSYPITCPDGQACDPARGACVECISDIDCTDGRFCTGAEMCSSGVCRTGSPPCAEASCDETADACVACLDDAACADGVFCNGEEVCAESGCTPGVPPCAAEDCDEALDICAGEFSAQILGCPTADVYFGIGVPLTAGLTGGVGERTRVEWTLQAEHATINSTLSTSIQLVIPEAEDVRLALVATDFVHEGDGWIPRTQTTAECFIPATLPKSYLSEAPVSGVLPGAFNANGGDIELSVSPLGADGELITEDMSAANFRFVDVVATHLATPGTIVTTAQVSAEALEVIEPSDPMQGVTVAITLDATGSMATNDPTRLRVSAAQTLVDLLEGNDVAAVLEFSRNGQPPSTGFYGARLLQTFTNDHRLLNAAIETIGASGTTPLFDALLDGVGLLKAEAEYNPAIVVLTDGLENASTVGDFKKVVDAAVLAAVPIFPVALGQNIDFSQLQDLARTTEGTFASALNPQELEALFRALGTAVTKGRTIVTASVTFDQPLPEPGVYTVSGTVETTIGRLTRASHFSFQIEVGNAKLLRAQSAAAELR